MERLPFSPTWTLLIYIYMRESLMLYSIDDSLRKQWQILVYHTDGISAACSFCKRIGIKRQYFVSCRSRFGFDVKRSRRRCLTGSQSVVLIVCDDIGQIDISSSGMQEVTKSDSISITIASVCDDRQIRIA